jgi:hypothetical protein
VRSRCQPRRHLKTVDAGQLNIQQHHLRAKTRGSSQRRRASPASPTTAKPSASSNALADDRKPSWSSTISTVRGTLKSSHAARPSHRGQPPNSANRTRRRKPRLPGADLVWLAIRRPDLLIRCARPCCSNLIAQQREQSIGGTWAPQRESAVRDRWDVWYI